MSDAEIQKLISQLLHLKGQVNELESQQAKLNDQLFQALAAADQARKMAEQKETDRAPPPDS